tara:strand:- start:1293 stop:3095 length:1803 start_codon:yes stop_codon:yes gene_type:complete
VFDQAKNNGAKGDGFDHIEQKLCNPPSKQLQKLTNLYKNGMYQQLLEECEIAIKEYPKSYILYNILGLTNAVMGLIDASIKNYKTAIMINPHYAESFFNLGVVLQEHKMLKKAVEAYDNALNIRPDYVEALYNKGTAFKNLGLPEKAILSYQAALSIKPDYVEIYNNMGNVHKDLGETEKALELYEKALCTDPNYYEAHFNKGNALKNLGLPEKAILSYQKALFCHENADVHHNMGNALKDLGRVKEAISSYERAINLQPNYSHAHRTLTNLKKYSSFNAHFRQVKKLHNQKDLSDEDKCNLGYALAKIYEDMGKIKLAFEHFAAANSLRKRTLKYSVHKDQQLFKKIKSVQPRLKKYSMRGKAMSIEFLPVFIVGMPRSGTTLVEQIISSHSRVTGAGELNYVSKYGHRLATIQEEVTKKNIAEFRDKYLLQLVNRADNKRVVTDKMPQNFLYLPLICSAFEEAKIIHVHRNAKATCWSNFKHYFANENLGFSYDLQDIVLYYQMYFDLMQFWQSEYGHRIYSLDYERLTQDQEQETKQLIKYLGLTWENRCLSPQENKRSVMTASQQQVRKKVYKGSSKAWRKYKSYLIGAFDDLPSF